MRALAIGVLLVARAVHADPGRHLVYGELLGKAGEYGIGYELAIPHRLALGVAASFAVVRDEQIATVAPYLHATAIARGPHALFGELGAIVAHTHVPSPVADWTGMSATGGGGFASLGYEHASRHLVLRVAGSAILGEGGLAPAIGFAVGVRP
jgi:hypothetical protein